jgi:hypothetical protein
MDQAVTTEFDALSWSFPGRTDIKHTWGTLAGVRGETWNQCLPRKQSYETNVVTEVSLTRF